MRYYAIGDIHGQSEMLLAAHARIEADREFCGDAAAPVIHLGDLVDRGPDSKGVLDILIEGQAAGRPWIAILGNHDRMFLGFLSEIGYRDPHLREGLNWLDPRLGGAKTLASYGVKTGLFKSTEKVAEEAAAKVPKSHRLFLRDLPLYHETPEVLFVHAGIRPGVPLVSQSEDDMVWIRKGFLEDTSRHPWLIVHGHTPVDEPLHFGNRVDIDTGAGFGHPLTAIVVEGSDCWVLTDHGREPLLAPW